MEDMDIKEKWFGANKIQKHAAFIMSFYVYLYHCTSLSD